MEYQRKQVRKSQTGRVKLARILAGLLIVYQCMTSMLVAPQVIYAQEVGYTAYTGQTGQGNYTIETSAQLAGLAAAVNNGTDYEGSTFLLAANINLFQGDSFGSLTWTGGTDWIPIGTSDGVFNGTFSGGNNKITGLKINSAVDYQGLFGLMGASGMIKNVVLEGCDIIFSATTGLGYSVGGIVGSNEGGTVDNCRVEGSIASSYYSCRIGGIAGYNGGTVTNCSNAAALSGSSICMGGIVGITNGGTVDGCVNTGTVKNSSTSIPYTGGIIGRNVGTVRNCRNMGEVESNHYSGGITGYNVSNSAILENCCNIGNVTGGSISGGIVGVNEWGTVSNCYSTGNVLGGAVLGGLVGENRYTSTVKFGYWNTDAFASPGISTGTGDVTGMTGEDMKKQSFVDILNGNRGTDDKLRCWTIEGSSMNGGYPVLAISEVINTAKTGISIEYNGNSYDVSQLFNIDGNAGTPTYTIESSGSPTGTGTIAADGKTLTVTKAGTFTIGLETAATATHAAGTKVTATLTVSKGSQGTPSAPASTGKTATTVTLTANSAMEFRKDDSAWQTSNVFSGLSPNTEYSFYQRLKATDLYNASAASAALSVTTDKTKLAAPSGVSVSNTGKLMWSAVTGASSYTIKVYTSDNVLVKTITGNTGTIYQFTNTDGLTAGTGYYARITAIGSGVYTDSDESAASTGRFNVYSVALTTSGYASGDTVLFNGSAVTSDTTTTINAIHGSTVAFTATAGSNRKVEITGDVTASGDITNITGNKAFTATFSALPELGKVSGAVLSATGQATWTNLSSETGLANYSVQLYKDSSPLGTAKTGDAGTGAAGVSFLSEMRAAGVGSYMVAVTAIGNGTTHTSGAASDASSAQSVAKLPAPGNLAWSGNNATFDKLTAETNVAKYSIIITGTGTVASADVTKTGSDLSVPVTSPASGDTFKVKAIASVTGLYLDSDESDASAAYAAALISVTNEGRSDTVTYTGSTIDLSGASTLFSVNPKAGDRTYTVELSTGAGTIGTDNKTLTVTKAGTFTIGLETAATATHAAGALVTATLTVSKGSQSTPSAPASTGKTDTSVTLAADHAMEFSKDGSTWQTSNVFSGLSPNTAYSFYQRFAATDLYNASGASAVLSVTTASATCTVTVINGTGSGDFAQDAIVTVTADTPSPGQRFKGWTATGLTGADLTQNPLTFTMPANNVELTATYEEVYVSEVENGTDANGVTVEGLSDLFADANLATEEEKGFTQQDKDYVDNGGTVRIVLSVEKKEEDAAQGAPDIIGEASLNNQTIGLLLNLEVLKYRISSNDSIEDIIGLTELNTLLTIVIPLPEEMQGMNNYSVYRYHGNSVDIITSVPNTAGEYIELTDNGTTITLHARKFSTYGIAFDENNSGTGGDVSGGDVSGGDVSGGDVSSGDAGGSRDKGGNGSDTGSNSGKDMEPATGDNSLPIATIAMIGGLAYLMDLLLNKKGKRRLGMTEAGKNRIVETIIQNAKKHGKIARLLALGMIFIILVFYYSVGRIVEFAPNELA